MKNCCSFIAFVLLFSQNLWADMEPVWSLTVNSTTDQAQVVQNEFVSPAYSPTFPVQNIRVKNFSIQTVSDGGERPSPVAQLSIAPLDISPEGELLTSSVVSFPQSAISSEENNPRYVVLPTTTRSKISPNRVINLGLASGAQNLIQRVELSPNDKLSILHTEKTTYFIRSGNSGSSSYPHRTSNVSFSKTTGNIAAVYETQDIERAPGIPLHGIALFDQVGNVINESTPGRVDYGQADFASDGETLIYSKKVWGGPDQTVALQTATGESRVLEDVPNGFRYYSGDNKFMLVVVGDLGGHGTADYFDVTDPLNPVRVSPTFQTSTPIITGAVCNDGSLIALQTLEPESQSNKHVAVFDIQNGQFHEKAVVISQTDMEGVQFEGKFLFVGVQRHPLPVGVHFKTTTLVNLYDFNL